MALVRPAQPFLLAGVLVLLNDPATAQLQVTGT